MPALAVFILLLAHMVIAGTPNRVTILYDSFGKSPTLTMDWQLVNSSNMAGKLRSHSCRSGTLRQFAMSCSGRIITTRETDKGGTP
jgi:hypothetical protein